MRMFKIVSALLLVALISCSTDKNEPINAITNLNKFSHAAAESKYKQVTAINKEDLYGDWTIISSFFTIKDSRSVTTFGIEGRKFSIKEDGNLIIDNSALASDKKYQVLNRNWALKSNNTVFDDGKESYRVRVKGDTMEWIEQTDEDYMYFVLVK